MSIDSKIQASYEQNTKLLKELSDTDYAPSSLEQNGNYIKDLINEVAVRERTVKNLQVQTVKEKADHIKYSESTMKRLAYKVGGKKGKFEEKAAKEEREYLEALQDEHNAKKELEMLNTNLAQARQNREELQKVAARHVEVQKSLDALHNSIFAGRTAEYPEEDAKEEPVQQATEAFNSIQLRLSNTNQVRAILQEASKYMTLARRDIAQALDMSEMDMWGFGGTYADMMERSALSQAQANMSFVNMHMAQARRIDPTVEILPETRIAQGNLMSDIIFDNIFSDMAFHEKIEGSAREVGHANRALSAIVRRYDQVNKALSAELGEAKEVLEQARLELQNTRNNIFERVAGGLPAYSE